MILLTRPSGPIFGAKEDVAPTSPPTHLRKTWKKKRKTGCETRQHVRGWMIDLNFANLINTFFDFIGIEFWRHLGNLFMRTTLDVNKKIGLLKSCTRFHDGHERKESGTVRPRITIRERQLERDCGAANRKVVKQKKIQFLLINCWIKYLRLFISFDLCSIYLNYSLSELFINIFTINIHSRICNNFFR